MERVAQLLLAAASPAEDWVPDWLCAGVDSLAVRAPEVAAELTGRVLDELADDDPRRERLGATLVTVLRLLARYDEVDRVAGALLAQASDPGCAGRTAWALAYALLGRGKRAQALELVEDTLRRWPTVVPWAARLRALWGVLIVDEHQQFDVARDTAEEVIAEGEQTGDRFAVGFGLHVLSMVAEADTKLAYVDRALTVVADHLDGADLRLLLSSNKAGVLMSLGRTDEAEHTIREALTLAEQTGTPRMHTLRSRAAKIYYSLGRWDDALVELEIAAAELLEDRPVTAYAAVDVHSLAALIAAHRDDRAGMERHLSMVDNVPPACHGTDVSPFTRALVAEREGRFSVALELLAAQVRATEDDPREIHGDRLPVVVRLALATGHRELARWATGLSEREARAESGPSTHAAARRCHGLLDAKVVDVRAAVDAYRGIGEVPALAGSLEDLAVVYGQRGEVQEGRAAYAEAVEIYQGLGAATDLARARSRVRPYGISAGPRGGPTRPVSGWYALTTTERKIAALVAEGLSNPDIASRLFLSRRTVQSHVSHILTKLGARSRVDIAREAALHPA